MMQRAPAPPRKAHHRLGHPALERRAPLLHHTTLGLLSTCDGIGEVVEHGFGQEAHGRRQRSELFKAQRAGLAPLGRAGWSFAANLATLRLLRGEPFLGLWHAVGLHLIGTAVDD